MKKCYALEHDGWVYHVASINNRAVRINTRILASKVVRKNHPIQYTLGVISCAEQCVEGTQMNWALLLINELIEDAVVV